MLIIPNYCRIMRIMREIPPEYLTAGVIRIDLRRDFDFSLKNSKLKNKIQEIRFREIGFNLRDLKKGEKIDLNIELKISKYKASDGLEYFLEFINKENILFGLLRLRICPPSTPFQLQGARSDLVNRLCPQQSRANQHRHRRGKNVIPHKHIRRIPDTDR